MKSLSRWAKHNPVKARITIIILHVLLITIAVFTGTESFKLGIVFPISLLYCTAIVFVIIACLYPSKKEKNTRYSKAQFYIIQKTFDFIIGACSFLMVAGLANNSYRSGPDSAYAASNSVYSIPGEKPTAEEILASLSYRDKSTLTRAEKRILKTEFRHQLKIYAKAKLEHDDEAAAKAVFIILSIIAAVGLIILVAGLACTLSCNGSEAGAILLAVLGISAIIWLLVVVIKKIHHHTKNAQPVPSEPKSGG